MKKENYKALLEGVGFEKKVVYLNEHTVHFETKQNAEEVKRTVVLSHGACGSSSYMAITANEILETMPNTKVVVLDLPFHRYSIANEENEVNVHFYTRLVEELLARLKEQGELQGILQWLGWSMGGSIGLLLALRKNVQIDELTLLCSGPVWHTIPGLLQIPGFTNHDVIVEIFKSVLLGSLQDLDEELLEIVTEKYLEISPSGKVMVEDFSSLTPDKYDVVDKLETIKTKTLIIAGTKDDVALPELQTVMNEKIEGSKLVMIEHGHTFLLKPDLVTSFTQELKDFFDKE